MSMADWVANNDWIFCQPMSQDQQPIATPRHDKLLFEEACNFDVSWSEEYQKLERELVQKEQENIRRIKHLNRLGTWAQQDPTGPIIAGGIQQWVLAELKAALGSAYNPTAWQPSVLDLQSERDKLQQFVSDVIIALKWVKENRPAIKSNNLNLLLTRAEALNHSKSTTQ